MEYEGKTLRFFEFDCPFDHLGNKYERDLFGAILHLRKKGYLSRHNYGVLPTDTYDFIGKHFGVMVDGADGPTVLMSYRMVTLKRCKEFHLPLPVEGLFKNANAEEHLSFLKKLEHQSVTENRALAYTSSWTVAPELREKNLDLHKIYDCVTALNVFSFLEDPTQMKLACGSLRLKTHHYIQWLGYQLFAENGKTLPSFKQYNLNNEDVVALSLPEHSKEALETAQRHEFQWSNRKKILRPENYTGTQTTHRSEQQSIA